MAKLHIRSDGVRHSLHTIDGDPIVGVTEINLSILPFEPAVAIVSICLPAVDIEAHPLLSVESLQAAAKYHGFKLVPDEGEI